MTTRPGPVSRGGTPLRASAEMNLTPLIDVLLVMLIIFMTSLQLSKQEGLDVNLPAVERHATGIDRVQQIVLEYTADRRITINTQPVELATLEPRLRGIYTTREDRTLFIRGDGSLRYRDIVAVIDAAHGAGITRVGVVTPGALLQSRR